ncbi:hypothetical protein [Pseudomonas putida]|uniref:hypothetical protein n=1 Tax=Pseudomonas putida TaxID=303 RepID=UPI002167693F|nr:hypothetical protein [Pseudomonas putida]MCS4061748.1 putative flippase GtrA [Pseudomonas putida]
MKFLKIPAVRWVVMLPAAILAAMIAVLAMRFMNDIWSSGDPDKLTFFGSIGEAIVSSIGCAVLIWVASWMAPKGKLIIGVVLATLLGLMWVAGAIYSIYQSQFLMIIVCAGALLGIVSAVYSINQNPPDFGD